MKECKNLIFILCKQQRTIPVARHLLLCLSIFQLFNISMILSSCTESFSDRCRREAEEFTARQCPRLLSEYIILDSMVYVDEPQGFIYYHTVRGELDNDSLLTPDREANFRDELLRSIRNDLGLRRYKEHKFTFTYHYISASRGATFTEASFGPEDY